MHHSFDIEIAKVHGVNEAIFLNNLAFWISHNMANKTHFIEDRYWTYNSQLAFTKLFPYWSRQNIRTIIKSCIDQDLIIKKKMNKENYDHTDWYTLTDNGLKLFTNLSKSGCSNAHDNAHDGLKSTKQSECGLQGISDPQTRNMTDGLESTTNKVRINPSSYTDSKQQIINKDICAPHAEKPSTGSRSASDDARVKSTFDEFWSNYKRKKDKARAFEVWKKKRLWEKADDILLKLIQQNSYDAQYQTVQYIPHATTYLRNARWEDEITPVSKNSNRKESSVERAIRMCMN